MGKLGKAMPPAWKGAGISHHCCGPEGQIIGRILPGEGLYLDCDLKYLGIKKRIPHVVERTPMSIVRDWLLSDAAAITSLAGIQGAIKKGQSQTIFANTQCLGGYNGQVVSQWQDSYSLQQLDSGFSLPYPASPGSALDQTYYSGSSSVGGSLGQGALNPTLMAPHGSNTAYLIGFGVNSMLLGQSTPNGYNMHIIADALFGIGSVSIATTTPATWTPPALTRYTTGAGVLALIENGNTSSTATGTFTLGYTNQAGATSISAPAVAANGNGGVAGLSFIQDAGATNNTFPFVPLAAGDYGVQAVTSLSNSVGSGAGIIAQVALYYPLCFVAASNRGDDYSEYDLTSQIHGLIPLQVSSGNLGCLSLFTTAAAGHIPLQSNIMFRFVQG